MIKDSVVGDMADKATNMVSGLINFDDINVEKFMGYVNQFGLMGKIKEISPAIAAKLEDGTISDEDVKSFIPEIKDIIMSKLGMGTSEDAAKAGCTNCVDGVCTCA